MALPPFCLTGSSSGQDPPPARFVEVSIAAMRCHQVPHAVRAATSHASPRPTKPNEDVVEDTSVVNPPSQRHCTRSLVRKVHVPFSRLSCARRGTSRVALDLHKGACLCDSECLRVHLSQVRSPRPPLRRTNTML
eukprot:358829-Chlamydomonas_euryale.AAC.13